MICPELHSEEVRIFEDAKAIIRTLKREGYIAYIAGGWVRDKLLGNPSSDIDIATNAPPAVIQELFPRHISIGAHFGVVVVLMHGHPYEVATFRTDLGSLDGRRPKEVRLADSAREDALRRDFTINGLFFDPLEERLIDYVGGEADIARGIVRTIGDPNERFAEDKLRMVRALRFAKRFNFFLEETTRNAIAAHAATLVPAVSPERLWQELSKMRKAPRFFEAIREMHQLGLLSAIFPPLAIVSPEQLHKRITGLEEVSEAVPLGLLLAQLFGTEDTSFIADLHRHLRAPVEEGKAIATWFRLQELAEIDELWHWAHLYADDRAHVALEVISSRLELPQKQQMREQHRSRQEELKHHIERLRMKNPIVKACDLMALGVQPGKRMGELLKTAERIAINCNLIEKDAIIAQLRQKGFL